MNKKIIFFFLLGLIGMNKCFGQLITVLEHETKKPIFQAHIIYKDNSSQREIVALTDTLGKIEIPFYQKKITISATGFQPIFDTIKKNEQLIYYLHKESAVMNEVVITAQFSPNSPEKAVHKIKIIDKKKIDAMGAQNLRDVLTNEMNIRISQDNVLGSSMSLQGISGQNVKILIDGVAVTGRLNGNIDISQINMNNVERIEIIEGPLSVNYGTDALAGTINIITKKNQKKSIEYSLSNYYESSGNYNISGRMGYLTKKNIFTLSGGRNYFDGWTSNQLPFRIEKTHLADSTRFQDWKPKEQYFGTFYFGQYVKNLKLGLTSDYFYEQIMNRGMPRLPYLETAFDDFYTTKRLNNSLSLVGKLSKDNYINLLIAFNHFTREKNTYFKDLTTLEQMLTTNSGDQDTSVFKNLSLRGSYSTTKDSTKINYEIGYDIQNETGQGIRIKNKSMQIFDFAIFGNVEYKPSKSLIIRPGVRLIHNTAFQAPIVPSINIRLELTKNSTCRFSYAKGFRAPSVKELNFLFVDINHNIVGNSNLKAEKSNNYNFSLTMNKSIRKTILWKIDHSYFYNQIFDMISLTQKKGILYTYFNIDKYQTIGTQLQSEFAWQHFKFSIGGAYVGRYNQLYGQHSTQKYTYSPEGKCNFFYEWKKHNITIGLFYKYTGKLPSFALNEENEIYTTKINAYNTADLSITKAFYAKRINLSIGSKNLFNVVNINGNSTGSNAHSTSTNTVSVGMGRTYFFKLDINLASKK